MSRYVWGPFFGVFVLLLGGLPAGSAAQPAAAERDGWWAPVHSRVEDRPMGDRAASEGRSGRGKGPPARRGRGEREGRGRLHVPKGHLPPRGQCRLWVPGRPPGQQPPPTSCREAYRQRRGPAVVVTHRGPVGRRSAPGWHRRPPEDVVVRRPPRERPRHEEEVRISVEVIIDVLGRRGYRRLEAQRRRLGIEGALTARWVSGDRSGTRVLQVRAGRHPLAELVDRTGDGRVDAFYVRNRRSS